jgi:RHS repeat-associated protein
VAGNGYDANGNTLVAGGKTFAYDSQDRMTRFNGGAVVMIYDGDGNRVAKTSGGVTTQYLVDALNPTGLAQVVEEVVSGAVQRRYTYGLQRISQTQAGVTSYYGYDGHGDVRFLTDSTGAVTDTYDYDAFGNSIDSTGTIANVYRYQGEALDAETGLYYLRARYYDPVAGRFLTVDPLVDQGERPYVYAGADPVNRHDPTGESTIIDASLTMWTPSARVPPPRDQISCWAAITFDRAISSVELMGLMLACQDQGRGGQGGGPPGKNPPCKCGDRPCCKWIDEHGADAIAAGLPEANTLALTAIESGWGKGYFVIDGGNSFFNLERCWTQGTPYPANVFPLQAGWRQAREANHKCRGTGVHFMLVATYKDSQDSFMSAATLSNPSLKEDDPTRFAKNAVAHGIYAGRDPHFLHLQQRFEKCLK